MLLTFNRPLPDGKARRLFFEMVDGTELVRREVVELFRLLDRQDGLSPVLDRKLVDRLLSDGVFGRDSSVYQFALSASKYRPQVTWGQTVPC